MLYKKLTAAQSTESLSDDEAAESPRHRPVFYGEAELEPLHLSPAQWSLKPKSVVMSHTPPEIIIHILKHLHSAKDLYSSLRVSRAWCECSVELLWHKPNFTTPATLNKMLNVISSRNQTFTYHNFVRRLNLLPLGRDVADFMFAQLAKCQRLERLTMVNCTSISRETLTFTLFRFPNLVAIDLTAVVEVTDHAIVGLASTARRLQGINLTGCVRLTDIAISALAENCALLRRVKLSNVELVMDTSIAALAKLCPLLLEIDLNHCKLITDRSIREIWTYSTHMRELRLSHCVLLKDTAFPAPPVTENIMNNPFPAPLNPDERPPLIINRTFEHLRMLDLTGCLLITDDAIEGVVSRAPKIRNLVLSKCTQLTDRSVAIIATLGRHLHYLHLGHAANINDSAVKLLARACVKLRYVDFANCIRLTDMAVFELSALPKLRRIGLVRVANLTDEAIYALAERHATLERIHLSYCDQISVIAVHFLVQKLHKLTHLSLTGVPAFRSEELQRFCRAPPSDFNPGQRAAFCVYSGRGVAELRAFLSEFFDRITDVDGTDDTEDEDYDNYEDEDYNARDTPDFEDDEQNPSPQQPPLEDFAFSMQNVLIPRLTQSHPGRNADMFRMDVAQSMHRQPQATLAPPPVFQLPQPVASGSGPSWNSAEPRHGALTPELNFAETGHGHIHRIPGQRGVLRPLHLTNNSSRPPLVEDNSNFSLPSTSSSMSQTSPTSSVLETGLAWPQTESTMSDELHDATPTRDPRGRRSVKRSFRNTLDAAEQYATTFLFGRHTESSPLP